MAAMEIAGRGIRFPCPGCGHMVTIITEPMCGFMHEEPTCPRFDLVNTLDDATALMREVRMKLAPESGD